MSVLINRDIMEYVLRSGAPLREACNRATGKTTGAVLRAVGESYRKPGEWVLVDDPDINTEFLRRMLVRVTTETLALLALKKIEVVVRRSPHGGPTPHMYGVYIRNTFAERLA